MDKVQRNRRAEGGRGFVGGWVGESAHARLHAAARAAGVSFPLMLIRLAERAEHLPAFLDGGTAAGAASQYDTHGDTAAGAG